MSATCATRSSTPFDASIAAKYVVLSLDLPLATSLVVLYMMLIYLRSLDCAVVCMSVSLFL